MGGRMTRNFNTEITLIFLATLGVVLLQMLIS